ncbi:MAG: histidine kinase dimerization/phosphoacceptor domain-containing protein [Dehalococcoidia bacterium]
MNGENHLDADGHELELHDNTIQILFALGLKIEYCQALLDEAPEEAKAGLDNVIAEMSELIADLRGRIDDIK